MKVTLSLVSYFSLINAPFATAKKCSKSRLAYYDTSSPELDTTSAIHYESATLPEATFTSTSSCSNSLTVIFSATLTGTSTLTSTISSKLSSSVSLSDSATLTSLLSSSSSLSALLPTQTTISPSSTSLSINPTSSSRSPTSTPTSTTSSSSSSLSVNPTLGSSGTALLPTQTTISPSSSSSSVTTLLSSTTIVLPTLTTVSVSSSTSAVSSSVPPVPIVTDQAYIDTVLRHHNVHRANHSAVAVTWSSSLAATAQKIASTCIYGHNTVVDGGGYGQNIGAGFLSTAMGQFITEALYNSEINAYVYFGQEPNLNTLSDWGHFSQIVWKSSLQVGCYTSDCSAVGLQNAAGIPPYFSVCNYSPPGNFVNDFTPNIGASLGQPTVYADYGCPSRANCVG